MTIATILPADENINVVELPDFLWTLVVSKTEESSVDDKDDLELIVIDSRRINRKSKRAQLKECYRFYRQTQRGTPKPKRSLTRIFGTVSVLKLKKREKWKTY